MIKPFKGRSIQRYLVFIARLVRDDQGQVLRLGRLHGRVNCLFFLSLGLVEIPVRHRFLVRLVLVVRTRIHKYNFISRFSRSPQRIFSEGELQTNWLDFMVVTLVTRKNDVLILKDQKEPLKVVKRRFKVVTGCSDVLQP